MWPISSKHCCYLH